MIELALAALDGSKKKPGEAGYVPNAEKWLWKCINKNSAPANDSQVEGARKLWANAARQVQAAVSPAEIDLSGIGKESKPESGPAHENEVRRTARHLAGGGGQ